LLLRFEKQKTQRAQALEAQAEQLTRILQNWEKSQ
jgi:hypothetical protein